mmetsp:Transcript_30503/g.71181  ORF Transcript_30503/g.71181 Transcript_30503/m.71181 type:complete len:282 (+) Transcript_30503:317-1162(+)
MSLRIKAKQTNTIEHCRHFGGKLCICHSLEATKQQEVLFSSKGLPQDIMLRTNSKQPLCLISILDEVVAKDVARSTGWLHQATQHGQGCGLTCPVVTKKSKYLPTVHHQIQVLYRLHFAIRLREMPEFHHLTSSGHHRCSLTDVSLDQGGGTVNVRTGLCPLRCLPGHLLCHCRVFSRITPKHLFPKVPAEDKVPRPLHSNVPRHNLISIKEDEHQENCIKSQIPTTFPHAKGPDTNLEAVVDVTPANPRILHLSQLEDLCPEHEGHWGKEASHARQHTGN